MSLYFYPLVILLLCIAVPSSVVGYGDPIDLEIYDLVEEVGIQQSFYDVLQVDKAAPVADIRRAYRKLSLVLHPDKNQSPDAEGKFRQLVQINEILKDAEKRKKYDVVLRDGLPDWRQPIYYYRKVKKLGLAELAILLLVVMTIGHYIVSWAVYLEKVFELEEIMAPVKKRRDKKRARGKAVADDSDMNSTSHILEENYGYKKPQMTNLLPFLMYRGTISFIKNLPVMMHDIKNKYEEHKERKRLEKEELEEAEVIEEKKPKQKKKKEVIKLRDASEFDHEAPVVNQMRYAGVEEKGEQQTNKANTGWTEDDLSALARSMVKFPGGLPGRWDRIALEVGRTVSEVTKKVKEMKTSLSSSGVAATTNGQSGVVGKRAAFQISDSVMTKAIESELNPKSTTTVTPQDLYTTQDEIPEDYDEGVAYNEEEEKDEMEVYQQVRKRKLKTRPDPVESESTETPTEAATNDAEKAETATEVSEGQENESESSAVDFWSQVQQKCLETALAHIPKTKPDRWTHIARSVPGKSKDECLQRYKLLVEHVKQRKVADNVNKKKEPIKVD